MTSRGVTACGAGLALICAAGAVAQPTLTEPRLRADVVATGLGSGQLTCSTGFMFVDAQTMLVVSRADGRVRRVDLVEGQTATPGATVLDLDIVVATVTDSQSEHGVQAIEPHPGFAENGWVYVRYDKSFTAGVDTPQAAFNPYQTPVANVIERYRWEPTGNGGAGALVFEATLRTTPMGTIYHHGGPIVFDAQSRLYTIYGDLRNAHYRSVQVPQGAIEDLSTVIRLTDQGAPAPGNPFGVANGAPAATAAWFAYGVRNSFGLAIDPATGDLWSTENGEGLYDEVNRVVPGMNGGWNVIMGPSTHPRQTSSLAGLVAVPGSTYVDPAFAWFSCVGVTGLHFLHGSALGASVDDRVVIGNFNTGFLWWHRLNASRTGFEYVNPGLADRVDDRASFSTNPVGTEAAELLLGRNFGAFFQGAIAVERGPDGNVYVLTTQGQVIRVSPRCRPDVDGDGMLTPDDLADYIAAFFSVPVGLRADYDASGRVDPDDLADYIAAYFGGCG
jgi:glucose/arabinose dehydrogenase